MKLALALLTLCAASGCIIHTDDSYLLFVHNNGNETLEVWASFQEWNEGLDMYVDRDWIRKIPAHDDAELSIDNDDLGSDVRVIVSRVSNAAKIFDETYTEEDFIDDHDRIDIDVE